MSFGIWNDKLVFFSIVVDNCKDFCYILVPWWQIENFDGFGKLITCSYSFNFGWTYGSMYDEIRDSFLVNNIFFIAILSLRLISYYYI